MQAKYDVLIVGGGIVGASCALELSRRGARVLLVEKNEDLARGCSYGNAGWVTPCFALPLPRPRMFFKSVRWLLNPDSPVYIKPRLSFTLVRWLWRFLLSMNQGHLERSAEALVALSKYSLEEYERLDRATGAAFGFSKKGLLMVAQTANGFDGAVAEMELMSRFGINGARYSEPDLKNFEPSVTGKVAGGVYFSGEAHLEPLAVVNAIAKQAEQAGATIMSGAEVIDFAVSDARVSSVLTTRGRLTADQYVLAAGVWSPSVARSLGLRVPVLGGKGYAVIVKPFSPAPVRPMMLVEKKIAVTPRDHTVRLAGTLELVGRDEQITVRRVDNIIRGAREFLSVPQSPEIQEIWRGLRPCTPDGVPMIGRPRAYTNLLLATGHQMLGVQSAPGTARLLADIALGVAPCFDPAPFHPDRFF